MSRMNRSQETLSAYNGNLASQQAGREVEVGSDLLRSLGHLEVGVEISTGKVPERTGRMFLLHEENEEERYLQSANAPGKRLPVIALKVQARSMPSVAEVMVIPTLWKYRGIFGRKNRRKAEPQPRTPDI